MKPNRAKSAKRFTRIRTQIRSAFLRAFSKLYPILPSLNKAPPARKITFCFVGLFRIDRPLFQDAPAVKAGCNPPPFRFPGF